jgi:tRNA-modifying protein YgfZ
MSQSPDLNLENPLAAQSLVFDRSHWGRIRLSGADRVRFLHNQTTQNIEQLSAGQGGYSVFVTSTGRTIDLATVYADPDSLLVVVSPGMSQKIYDWMDRYIFFSDKVTLTDESNQTFLFTVLGTSADAVLQPLGASDLIGKALFSHQTLLFAGSEEGAGPEETITVAVGSDLGLAGYTLWGPKAQADAVWQAILSAGAIAGSPHQWERLRIQQGRPAPGHELTDDDNPLEAGLWNSISFEKGCYIGQETIARLNTYQGVKKRLWGIKLSAPVEPGATISAEGAKIGRLTSVIEADSHILGLAYLRTKAGGAGLRVTVEPAAGEAEHEAERETASEPIVGEAIALPFIRHEYYAATNKNS